MKNFFIVILLACLIFTGCSSDSSNGEIAEATTQAVLDHHRETFVNNDLDGVMEDYTDESIFITPNGTYIRLEEIQGNFVNAFKAFPTQGVKYHLGRQRCGIYLMGSRNPSI